MLCTRYSFQQLQLEVSLQRATSQMLHLKMVVIDLEITARYVVSTTAILHFYACFCKQKNMGLVDVEYFLYIYLIKSLDDGAMSSCLCILKKKTCCL